MSTVYILADKPTKPGSLLEAFDAVDEAFGTGEFSEEQAVSAVALGMSVPDTRASQLFRDLIQQDFISETE